LPKLTTLLDSRERVRFAQWLNDQLNARGISKAELVAQLGYDEEASTEVVGRYLLDRAMSVERKVVFPTPYTLLRIANVLELPSVATLFRAGYYAHALAEIRKLERFSERWYAADRLQPVNGLIAVAQLRDRGLTSSDRYQSVGPGQSRQVSVIAVPTALAVQMIVAWLPLRGDGRFTPESDNFTTNVSSGKYDRLFRTATSEVDNLEPRRWPRVLRQAHDILNDSTLPPMVRRLAAAELVHHWARLLAPTFYDSVRKVFLKPPNTTT